MYNNDIEKGGKLHDSCKNCGFCERKCPQHLAIRVNLEKVESVLKRAE